MLIKGPDSEGKETHKVGYLITVQMSRKQKQTHPPPAAFYRYPLRLLNEILDSFP